ncbi:unnamed protein product [Orchesella dallaii]|uniref:Reverse transcriptase Ty1/copia-type domain-containing protein n=1 Tax=Orchesella dallaii TaxID=48710 RepID=A0ABP1RSS5_9HEXA
MPVVPVKKNADDSDEINALEKMHINEERNGSAEEDAEEDTLNIYASDEELFSSPQQSPKPTLNTSWSEQMEDEFHNADTLPVVNSETPIASRLRNVTERKKPDRFQAGFLCSDEIEEPSSVKEAEHSGQWNEWHDAMQKEMTSQAANKTWELVERPRDVKILRNRWVYKLKTDPLTKEVKFKARLVVKGFQQVKGIDYEETFAPVARYESVRLLLALAAANNWNIIQFDVMTAFLNSVLDKPVYMEQPEKFTTGENLVCKVQKGIYGLPEAPLAWYKTIKKVLVEMGFTATQGDPCVYIGDIDGHVVILAIFVDDGMIFGERKSVLEAVLSSIEDNFSLTRQPLKKFLGMEIDVSRKGIFVHQKSYVEATLKRFAMENCKPISIPMAAGLQLETAEKCAGNAYEYQNLIGSLLFISRVTRPDISYAVSYLSRFLTSYDEQHWNAAKNILRYLKNTKHMGILYKASNSDGNALVGYSDADYASDKNSRKSTTGCVFMYNQAPIVWFSNRQTCVALSSTEAEYVALSATAKEAVWLTRMYSDLRMQVDGAVTLYTDSQSAMKLAYNPEFHQKTKHIDVRHHYIRDLAASKAVKIVHLPDTHQPADLLTKSLVRVKFEEKRNLLGMQEMQKPNEQPRKRVGSAMTSQVVMPKKSLLTFLLMTMFLMAQGGQVREGQHQTGSAIIWRRSDYPVAVGYDTMKASIILASPCDLLPTEGISENISKRMLQECEERFHVLYLNELEKICPLPGREKSLQKTRSKRLVFMALAIVLVAALAVPGLIMGAYAIHSVHALETEHEKLVLELDYLEKQVMISNMSIELLKKEVKELAVSFDEYREESVGLSFLISYVTGRLMEGKSVLKETGQKWKKGELSESFFDFINFTQPCGEQCPVSHGIFHSCQLSSNMKNVDMEYSLPVINRNLSIMEVDPFDLMLKKRNQTCRLKYVGPRLAIMSSTEDCIYAVQTEKAPVGKLPLSSSLSCKPHLSFKKDDNMYRTETCKKSEEGDEHDYARVKVFDNKYFVYCPNGVYFLGKREVKCPNYVFTLPLSATFTLNNVEYQGKVLSIVYHQKEDPLFIEKINWHLSAGVKWDNLTEQFEDDWNHNAEEVSKIEKVHFIYLEENAWWTTGIIGVMLFGSLIAVVLCSHKCVKYLRARSRITVDKDEPKAQEPHQHNIIIRT